MAHRNGSPHGWRPLVGSWEESVLSWHEQIDGAFRRRKETKGEPGLPPALIERFDRRAPPQSAAGLPGEEER